MCAIFADQVCGGLTAFVTLGFAVGILKAPAFFRLESVSLQRHRLQRWYLQAGLSLLGLAAVATSWIQSILSPVTLAASVVLLSFGFAASMSIPFFQLPQLVSQSRPFDESQAICLAFMDGVGFVLTAPLWAASSRILSGNGNTWSLTWSFWPLSLDCQHASWYKPFLQS